MHPAARRPLRRLAREVVVRRRGLLWCSVIGAAACGASSARARSALDAAGDDLCALACEARRLGPAERIAFVNVQINRRIAYRADADDADHWSTPCETLARGHGDCEDFAIAKHFLLEASGVPAHLHRLLYARCWSAGRSGRPTPHLAAVAREPRFADPWVLDQFNPALLALSARDDLEPVFSFDAHAVWCGVGDQPLARGPLRAPGWLGVLERTRAQRR